MPAAAGPAAGGRGGQLSETETLIWLAGSDPLMRSWFVGVTILDRPPDQDRLSDRLAVATATIPRLRQVVQPGRAPGLAPTWVDDAHFTLGYHLRRLSLPPPGTERQLLDLAALDLEDAFDPARPLWRLTVVEGLEGGRAALLSKVHHVVTDGVGAVRLAAAYVDLERDPRPAPGGGATPTATPDARAGTGGKLAAPLALGRRVPATVARLAWSGVSTMVADPRSAARQVAGVADAIGRTLRLVLVTDGARSPLWTGRRSLGRRLEAFSLDLDGAHQAARNLGGTINDLFVAGVAAGAGAYHRAHGAEVAELRASVPVSTRTDASAGGNAFLPYRVLLPTGPQSPAERFALVHRRLEPVKSPPPAVAVTGFAAALGALPPPLVVQLARSQVATVDFAASNVRGARVDMYVAGARVLANFPMGPTSGTAFNATVLSSGNHLDVGLVVDTAAIPDSDLLRRCIVGSLEALVAAGSPT